MKVIHIILTFSLCNVALTSSAMLVRAAQPIAKRIASRIFTPKVTSQTPSIQHTSQLRAQAAKASLAKPANLFCHRSTQYMKLFKARPHYQRYYSRSTWWLPTALGIGAIAASTQDHAYAESDNNDQTKQYSIEQQYRNALEEEGTKLMNDFLKAINRTEEQWKQESITLQQGPFLKTIEEDIKKKQQQVSQAEPLSPKFRNAVTNLLKQHNIDPQIVTFMRNDSYPATMGVSGAPAVGKIGFNINEAQCNSLTQKELEWVILHEIQHLKHNDSFMRWVNTNSRHANNILHRYRIFYEKRADILAALTSLEHAKAAADFNIRQWNSYYWYQKLFYVLKIKNLYYEDGEHPAIEKRVTYTAKLYEELLAAEQNKKHITVS